MDSREKLSKILSSLKNRIASPSDVISSTGLPRYEVLAAFHILEALGLIELVYARGNYKLYKLSSEGEKVVDIVMSGGKFVVEIKPVSNLSNDEGAGSIEKPLGNTEVLAET